MTIVLTSHILDEAERCDRVGILNAGKLVATGTPDELKARVGGDVVTIDCPSAEALHPKILEHFGYDASVVDGALRVECPRGHEFVRDVVATFPAQIAAVRFGKPTLEDVFIKLTGHRLEEEDISVEREVT